MNDMAEKSRFQFPAKALIDDGGTGKNNYFAEM
jgi:hypothetical protein